MAASQFVDLSTSANPGVWDHVIHAGGVNVGDSCRWWFKMLMVVQHVDGDSCWWLRFFYAYVVVRIHLCHKSSKRTPAKSQQPISTSDQPLVDNL